MKCATDKVTTFLGNEVVSERKLYDEYGEFQVRIETLTDGNVRFTGMGGGTGCSANFALHVARALEEAAQDAKRVPRQRGG